MAFVVLLALLGAAPDRGAPAQVRAITSDSSQFVGNWTLNRELTSPTPSPDVPIRSGRRGGSGFGGGFGGGSGGGGGQAQPQPGAREEGARLVALMQELLTPPPKVLIAREAGETLAFTNAEGRTVRYTANNKTEKHQLTNGTIETKSRWNRGELRQEIVASDAIELVRNFAIDASTGQLVVTITLSGGGGSQDRPFRMVYERDEN